LFLGAGAGSRRGGPGRRQHPHHASAGRTQIWAFLDSIEVTTDKGADFTPGTAALTSPPSPQRQPMDDGKLSLDGGRSFRRRAYLSLSIPCPFLPVSVV
jgi:hypothetical protein